MSDDTSPSRTSPLTPPIPPTPKTGRKAAVPKRKQPGPYRVPPREHVAAERLGVQIIPLGDGFTWLTENIADDRALAEQGWKRVKETLATGTYDILILDELTYCLTYGWLDEREVIETLRARPAGTHVVVTGRDASPALIEAADLVTEMRLVKHPYHEQGIAAQPGIEL